MMIIIILLLVDVWVDLFLSVLQCAAAAGAAGLKEPEGSAEPSEAP